MDDIPDFISDLVCNRPFPPLFELDLENLDVFTDICSL